MMEFGKFLLAAILLYLTLEVSCQHRHIFLELDIPLRAGDEIVFEGVLERRPSTIRFLSSSTICSSEIPRSNTKVPRCQPLIIKFRPRAKKLEFSFKGADSNYVDFPLGEYRHKDVRATNPFRMVVEVLERKYRIFFNGEEIITLPDRVGHYEVNAVRSYGGNFSEYYIAYNNQGMDESEICGTRPALSTHTARIVGGTNAKRGEFPWQAALRRRTQTAWTSYQHYCGGSIISSCWILTAAHCMGRVLGVKDKYVFRVGDYYNKDDEENAAYSALEEQRDFDIAEVIIHEAYTSEPTPRNDVALVRLASPGNSETCIIYSRIVRPVCLPGPTQQFPPSTPCIITGWGALNWTDRPSEFPGILQKANVNIIDTNICRNNYRRNGEDQVAQKTVCAAGPGTDSCQGDSGGPLVCMDNSDTKGTHFVLWGVTSWGDGCAKKNKPGIYTKVIDFLDWINFHMNTPSTSAA